MRYLFWHFDEFFTRSLVFKIFRLTELKIPRPLLKPAKIIRREPTIAITIFDRRWTWRKSIKCWSKCEIQVLKLLVTVSHFDFAALWFLSTLSMTSLPDIYYFNLDDKNEKGILVQIQPCQVHGRSYQIADGSSRTARDGWFDLYSCHNRHIQVHSWENEASIFEYQILLKVYLNCYQVSLFWNSQKLFVIVLFVKPSYKQLLMLLTPGFINLMLSNVETSKIAADSVDS